MTELNHNLRGLALGGIRRFTTLAQERGDCILLTLGEPEFDTPGPIRQACKDALDRGRTHYTENRGDLALRQAISRFERQSRGLDYAPEEILITLGATEAIYTALTGVLNPGDEVIIPTPAFSLYDTVTRMGRSRAGAGGYHRKRLPAHRRRPGSSAHTQNQGFDPQLPQQPHRRHLHPGAPCRHRPADPRPGSVRPL